VRTAADGQDVVVVVSGEADLATAALLRDELVGALSRGPRSLVLDAVDLTFCDLRGLDALTDAVHEAEDEGVVVTLHPSTQLSWLMAAAARAAVTDARQDGWLAKAGGR
jgi:anti-sigma B factor antagonist